MAAWASAAAAKSARPDRSSKSVGADSVSEQSAAVEAEGEGDHDASGGGSGGEGVGLTFRPGTKRALPSTARSVNFRYKLLKQAIPA